MVPNHFASASSPVDREILLRSHNDYSTKCKRIELLLIDEVAKILRPVQRMLNVDKTRRSRLNMALSKSYSSTRIQLFDQQRIIYRHVGEIVPLILWIVLGQVVLADTISIMDL
jgi:hypothetical protein